MFIPTEPFAVVSFIFYLFIFFIPYQDFYYTVSLERGYIVLRGRDKDNILEPVISEDKPSLSTVRKNEADFFSKVLDIIMAVKK